MCATRVASGEDIFRGGATQPTFLAKVSGGTCQESPSCGESSTGRSLESAGGCGRSAGRALRQAERPQINVVQLKIEEEAATLNAATVQWQPMAADAGGNLGSHHAAAVATSTSCS